jgi:hypothetical protein
VTAAAIPRQRAKAGTQRSCVADQFITNVFAAGKIAKPAL